MSTTQIDRQTYRDLVRHNDLYEQQTDRQLTETLQSFTDRKTDGQNNRHR